jgi:hypothetical protein
MDQRLSRISQGKDLRFARVPLTFEPEAKPPTDSVPFDETIKFANSLRELPSVVPACRSVAGCTRRGYRSTDERSVAGVRRASVEQRRQVDYVRHQPIERVSL